MADPKAAVEAFKRWTIGDARITRILELPPMAFDPAAFLQTTREEVLRRRDWLVPEYATEAGDIILHFQAFVVEAEGKRIMVDPCIGNDKKRLQPEISMLDTAFLDRLSEAGFPRETIDVVLCTHLHVDHCGWNTMLVDGRWVPTFPNARYLFAETEVEHLGTGAGDGNAQAIYEDSVKPIFDAGLAELVQPGHVVAEGVWLEPTPGHTPGHCSVVVSSAGREAIITGDVLHHPLQVSMPEVSSHFDWDEEVATRTRRTILENVATKRTLMIPAHFAGPTGVHVTSDGMVWRVEEA